MNKYKKFIKDAYNGKLENLTMCQDWKQKIESEFPELLETKLEVGTWYKTYDKNKNVYLFNHQDNLNSYGFFRGYEWNVGSWDTSNNWNNYPTLATEEEVTQALIKEAEKRGIKEGVKLSRLSFVSSDSRNILDEYDVSHPEIYNEMENKSENGFYLGNKQILRFIDGKWAEPIKTISKAEAEKQLNAKIID